MDWWLWDASMGLCIIIPTSSLWQTLPAECKRQFMTIITHHVDAMILPV